MISAQEALARLKAGNHDFVTVRRHERDLSSARVEELYAYGQTPFAVVLTCSDSRTVPEHMFMMGLGDLFVIRVAGNVVAPTELASVVYACEHLQVKLVLVLGHTHCGAIEAAMEKLDADSACVANGGTAAAENASMSDSAADWHESFLDALTVPIGNAIGGERDPYRASVLNVRAGIAALWKCPDIAHLEADGLQIAGAIYHTHSGVVDFLD